MANSALTVANTNFNDIKASLKTFLKSQSEFQDFNFEGSNLNVLLDVLSYNTFFQNFYLNQVASESFLDSAQLRDSIVSHAKTLNYLPKSDTSAKATVDIEIQAKEIMYHKANLNRLMAFHTGQDVKQIDEDTDRDRYMSPLEAKNYGIIDEIIGGDDAGLKIEGEPQQYLKTKASYISWGDEIDTLQ